MDPSSFRLDLLSDPQVKAFFLRLLESPLPDEVKYQKFVAFCAQRGIPESRAGAFWEPALESMLEAPGWGREELLSQVLESIRHAIRRMQRSQHQDGGWGVRIEQSNFWHTAYAMLFLKTAGDQVEHERTGEFESMLRRGAVYLEQHPEGWAPDTTTGLGGMSVYDISLMVQCFYRVGRPLLRREPGLRVYHGLERLYHSQNEDGGWDATIWGYEVSTPVRVWSEAGATGAALQALAETHDERFQAAMAKGMQWLASTQNPDGSWNDSSCRPEKPGFRLEGCPSIDKTCAAIQGLLAGESLDLSLQPYRDCMERAADWLLCQAEPVVDRRHHADRWRAAGSRRPAGRWQCRFTADDYDHIGLILDTVLGLPEFPPFDLAPYAAWLAQTQRRQADDPEDGGWVLGHTARIGLALAAFYRTLNGEPRVGRVPWIS